MANVIREDVIQVSFDIDKGGLTQINSEMNDLKNSVTGGIDSGIKDITSGVNDLTKAVKGVNGDGIEELKNTANGAKGGVDKLKNTINDVKNSLTGGEKGVKGFTNSLKNIGKISVKGLISGLDKVGGALNKIASKAAGAAYNGLKKMAGVSFKALAAGLTGAATALGVVVKQSVSSFADYEQLVGGVDTLFGDASKTVQANAQKAFQTAGLSANQYMETVTSFSASLINSVGGDTKKAADMSDMALKDMSDNANKMGTDMETIMGTYQSLAKGNYAMLDNLKLGKIHYCSV